MCYLKGATAPLIGVGYRAGLKAWIDANPPEIQCLELTAEHFFDGPAEDQLVSLRARYPLFVHGLGLSLGTPGPPDRDTLNQFCRVVEVADPEWISEHVAFTRSHDVDLGHLNACLAGCTRGKRTKAEGPLCKTSDPRKRHHLFADFRGHAGNRIPQSAV